MKRYDNVIEQACHVEAAETDNSPDNKQRIYSIGHSCHDINEFIRLVTMRNVTTIVDVRSSPASKKYKQYNRIALTTECEKHGIKYRHRPQLGSKATVSYTLIEQPDGQAALEQLADEYVASGRDSATAIMCAEHNNTNCHRRVMFKGYMMIMGL